jgi:hypothetical protein
MGHAHAENHVRRPTRCRALLIANLETRGADPKVDGESARSSHPIVADAITSCDHRPMSKGIVSSAGLGRVLHATPATSGRWPLSFLT